MPKSLLTAFLSSSFDHYELLSLFQSHYGSARSTPENDVIYPASQSFALKVRCKGSNITNIEAGPALHKPDLKVLLDKVRTELLESPGTAVGADIIFCSWPVRGSFRSSSTHIQILPAPKEAPQPPVLMADHPFILEFPIRRSQNEFITGRRRLRARTEWTWVLNALTRDTIKYIGQHPQHFWALWPEESKDIPTQDRLQWAQEFVSAHNFE